MKKIFLLLIVFSCHQSIAQVQSSCTVPQLLNDVYEKDIKTLVLNRMFQLGSPDTNNVHISQAWQDTIAEGLAAIFNATSIPERDSVFNLYCVHDVNDWRAIYNDLLIRVDTNYTWTQAWQNLSNNTGNPFIDGMTQMYGLSVSAFYNWSFGNYAIIHTDSLLNIKALIDSLKMDPAIIEGEPDAIIGGAGHITYNVVGNERFYDFYFEFQDCFDGCDNYRVWQYKVDNNCIVTYLGAVDYGIFGILPLPPPINCNLFVGIKHNDAEHYLNIFPCPVTNQLNIKINSGELIKSFNITDITGRLVFRKALMNSNEATSDVSVLSSGMYIININTSTGFYTAKFTRE